MAEEKRQQGGDEAEEQEEQEEQGDSSGRVNDPLAQRDQVAPRTDWKPDK